MNFLLKIVQGPNAGAEIALTEGFNISLGRADSCDIVLNDASVGDVACELEVSGERVMIVLPDGKRQRMENFHVKNFGTTSIVVGPAEGEWSELVWKSEEKEEPAPEPEETETAPAEKPTEKKKKSCGCIIFFLLLIALFGATGYFAWKNPEKAKEYATKAWSWIHAQYDRISQSCVKKTPPPPPREKLDDVARACGFKIVETNGTTILKGDFQTRAARLEATARAYNSTPGVQIDFCDVESLRNSVDELLFLVTEGALKVSEVKGRNITLDGFAPSVADLHRTLKAIQSDVPKVEKADCAKVVIAAAPPKRTAQAKAKIAFKADVTDKKTKSETKINIASLAGKGKFNSNIPMMPVVGVLTVPYPCLVLRDGSRVMEGASIDGFTVEKIESDRITVRNSAGTFTWRP